MNMHGKRLFAPLAPVLLLQATALAQGRPINLELGLEQMQAQQWEAAFATFSTLAEANPFDGVLQFNLGMAASRMGDCGRARPALESALQLGVNGTRRVRLMAQVVLAGCAAQAGDTAAAFTHLENAWRHDGLRDWTLVASGPRFASIVGTPRFRELAGIPADPGTDRAAAWRADLAYLDRLVRETHPAPFHSVSPEHWDSRVATLRDAIPTLSDAEVELALMQLLALVGDGHTGLRPAPDGDAGYRLLPIWPVYLADGWHIAAAAPGYERLVGGRWIGAGDRSIEELDSLARTALPADNHYTARWLAQFPLQMALFHRMAGTTAADSSVIIRVIQPDNDTVAIPVRPDPSVRDPGARWAPADWPAMFAGSRSPAFVQYAEPAMSIEWLPRERVVLAVLNIVGDTDEQSFLEFGASLRDTIAARNPRGLILDLRNNNGGNGTLIPPFLLPLLSIPLLQEADAFQVLTGPRTYSAGVMLLNELLRYTEARTVGWPTGGRPVQYGTETPFRLPVSGLIGTISTHLVVAGVDAGDTRPTFAPMMAAWPTARDVRQGRDPVIEAALRLITQRR